MNTCRVNRYIARHTMNTCRVKRYIARHTMNTCRVNRYIARHTMNTCRVNRYIARHTMNTCRVKRYIARNTMNTCRVNRYIARHTMNTCRVNRYIARHIMNTCRVNRYIAWIMHYLGNEWRWVINLALQPIYPRRKNKRCLPNMRLCGWGTVFYCDDVSLLLLNRACLFFPWRCLKLQFRRSASVIFCLFRFFELIPKIFQS